MIDRTTCIYCEEPSDTEICEDCKDDLDSVDLEDQLDLAFDKALQA